MGSKTVIALAASAVTALGPVVTHAEKSAQGPEAAAPVEAPQPLTEDQARRFAASLAGVKELTDKLKAEESEAVVIDMAPADGEPFEPYSKAMRNLAENYPEEHEAFEKVLKPHGFDTTEWGAVGDRVIIAYMAVKMDEENPGAIEKLASMEEGDIAGMSEAGKAQWGLAMKRARIFAKASRADRAIVRAVKPELDAVVASLN